MSVGPRAEDRERPLVDPESLERFLDGRLPGPGRVEVERHMAGHSNETFFVSRGRDEWVLRRPPRGAFLPTAHDVLREYRVLSALARTAVRAPRPVLACPDETVIGAPFYLMERVHGFVIRDELPPGFGDPATRTPIGDELVDALAELHAVDWRAVGLEGWGRPTGYLARQVKRWRGQLELATQFSRPLPDLVRVGEWLAGHVPPDAAPTIVQGDYKLDNVAFDPNPPARLLAIFDWEMATIGDPLADLGYMTATYPEPGDDAGTLFTLAAVTTREGFPTRAELLDRYEDRSGRSMSELRWYQTLALWKSAVFLEGSYKRLLAGTTDDPFFKLLDEGVPEIARRAWDVAHSG